MTLSLKNTPFKLFKNKAFIRSHEGVSHTKSFPASMLSDKPSTPSSYAQRPIREFSPEEAARVQDRLESTIPAEGIAYRSASGTGGTVAYLEGWRAFKYANEIFGFNGWSSEILNFTIDFIDVDSGRVSVGISCTVRILLKDGTFHDVPQNALFIGFEL